MTLHPPELKYLTPLKQTLKRCVHLQCAGGSDTLSLINFGAEQVIGLDISEQMLQVAEAKSLALGMNATWVHSDILEVPAELNGIADLVYTGKGAINWMMDIERWASVVARILKPGGRLYLFEGHPFTYLFDMKASQLALDPIYRGYFSEEPYASQDWPDTYIGKLKESVSDQAVKYERPWPVSAVISALLKAGLMLEAFEEHPDKFWDEFENLPEDLRTRFPNTYSVLARKPF
ncbi:MAG: class I SAM-dependent methyltransferase [Bdellovibrionota bacterium]